MTHIYIHFPYCLKKCHYCDFNSYACRPNEIPHEEYVRAVVREVSSPESRVPSPSDASRCIDTIFLGGGTPSLMRPQDIERIFNEIQKRHSFSPNIEITLEVNPGSMPVSRLLDFKAAGINRFSIGVQSFDDANLKWFGRIHSADEGRQMVRAAQGLSDCRVSLDLIYGFPNQTVEDWKRNLEEAVELGVKHLSAYALSVDCHAMNQERFMTRNDMLETDLSADLQQLNYEFLETAGLPAYEISNFAVPGEESRHNLGYWRYEEFLGFGAGAVGQYGRSRLRAANNFVTRSTNLRSPTDYMHAVMSGERYSDEEHIDEPTAQFEFMMMGLRTRKGVSEKRFEERFAKKMFEVYAEAIARTSKSGLLEIHTDSNGSRSIAPSQQGMCLNNQLVGEFLSNFTLSRGQWFESFTFPGF